MYDLLVNLLVWTAAGAVGYLVVYLVRWWLAERRSRNLFTKATYDLAIHRAAKNARSMEHLYLALPEGEVKKNAFAIFTKRQELLKAICKRENRELGLNDARYGQTRSMVE